MMLVKSFSNFLIFDSETLFWLLKRSTVDGSLNTNWQRSWALLLLSQTTQQACEVPTILS